MKHVIFLITLMTAMSSTYAGNGTGGRVSSIEFLGSGTVIFKYSGERWGDIPGCATKPNRWAFSATTPAGQAQLSGLLLAYSSNIAIEIRGAGVCAHWGDTETVKDFWTAN